MSEKIQRIQLVIGENFFIQGQGVLTHIEADTHNADMELDGNVINCTLYYRADKNGDKSKRVAIPLTNVRSIIYKKPLAQGVMSGKAK